MASSSSSPSPVLPSIQSSPTLSSFWSRPLPPCSSSLFSLFQSLSVSLSLSLYDSPAFASLLDSEDPLRLFRSAFFIPSPPALIGADGATEDPEKKIEEEKKSPTGKCVYFCGNSLGLLNNRTQHYVSQEMTKWSIRGVEGHFSGPLPWARIDERPTALSKKIVGAESESEIAIMNSLSANLHLLLLTFYRPTKNRYKIIMEEGAFCSDSHIIKSQISYHNLNEADTLILLKPRSGEYTLRHSDILEEINKANESLALVLLPGIQFYTGQYFLFEELSKASHAVGALIGLDCAHAVGNIPLELHKWDIDFAAWCSYKYLNAGPGSIGGLFVHSKYEDPNNKFLNEKRLFGWWGQEASIRFQMKSDHKQKRGAQSFMLSNPAVLPTVSLLGSLELFDAADINNCRKKSIYLTGYLYLLLIHAFPPENNNNPVRIITPIEPQERGCQLSLLFQYQYPARKIFHLLEEYGQITTDVREPDVIRVSPTPLYNTFQEVYYFVQKLIIVIKIYQHQLAQEEGKKIIMRGKKINKKNNKKELLLLVRMI